MWDAGENRQRLAIGIKRQSYGGFVTVIARAVTVLCLLFCALGARAADKLVADFAGHAGFQSATWMAKDLKIFDKYGLDVDLVMITGGARAVAALLGGSTQFSTGSSTAPLLAAGRGSDVLIVGASYNKFPGAIVVKPEIRTPGELRGKRLGILNFGGSNDLGVQLAFKEWGLKPGEVTVIISGDAPTRLAALLAGRIDSTLLSPPHLKLAVDAGYRVLADMGQMRANFSQSTLYVRRTYMAERRDIVKRFIKAYSEAVHVFKTDRERSLKVLTKRMRVDDPEVVSDTYDYYAPRFSFPPYVDMAGIKDTLDFYAERNPEMKNRKPQEFVDHAILDELQKEGFFKTLR
jgi:NitT/TauT family transport system substrate-binding protein